MTTVTRNSNRHKFTPHVVRNHSEHTMGESLLRYIDIKIHHLIKENQFEEIRVIGEYDRKCSISKCEKNDKITNWQRPTAEVHDNTLLLKCFPGNDYVKHYASLVSSYLAMNNRRYDHVSYSLPSDQECWDVLDTVGFDRIPKSDIVVLGYGLPEIAATDKWEGNSSIQWYKKKIGNQSVTFLIVQFSYWGDILRRIMNLLANQGFNTAIFTAKVGGINEKLTPNVDIVTGDNSMVDGEMVKWDNLFSLQDLNVISGTHINSSSVMLEVPEWLERMKHFDFVDSEIGQFAKGASESRMRFGYIHYISNLLSKHYSEDLSNERLDHILQKRKKIKQRMKKYIENTIKTLG